jgi:adenylate cyclase
MGDGLLALFGLDDAPEPALRAVRAGLHMIRAAREFEPYLQAIYSLSGFRIRVGIHYGYVVVGAIGSASSKRITAIGDAVNLASRIEEANKAAGTQLLISEEAYAQLGGRAVLGKSFRTELRGKSGQYALYEVTALNQSSGNG